MITQYTTVLHPSEVLIIEGLFALYTPEIREMEDIKIFVDTPADERFIRRLRRDVRERARTVESITDQYLTTVKPMHEQFIEPTKKYADIIIPRGKSNLVAIDLLKTKIHSNLKDKMILKGEMFRAYEIVLNKDGYKKLVKRLKAILKTGRKKDEEN